MSSGIKSMNFVNNIMWPRPHPRGKNVTGRKPPLPPAGEARDGGAGPGEGVSVSARVDTLTRGAGAPLDLSRRRERGGACELVGA